MGGFLCLIFIVHFSLTAIYNAPSNPLQAKFNKQLSMYMDPLFTQNWRLFAPTPATTNNYFYVKAKVGKDGKSRTTDWIDISHYMYEANQTNRFTPHNRILRIPRGAFGLMGESDETILKIMKKINEGKLEENKYKHLVENEKVEATEERAIEILNRFAEAQLATNFPNETILEYKVLLVDSKPIPFSKNREKNYENEEKYMEFEWTKPLNVVPLF